MKIFVTLDELRNNALQLAHKIYEDGFLPDIIYVSLRGGAYMGNVISEYFKILQGPRRGHLYAAVVANSYTDIRKRSQVKIQGWTFRPEQLNPDDKILLVDDIYDSGHTINKLMEIFVEYGVLKQNIKVTVHDYKERKYLREQLQYRPDYFAKHHVIEKAEDDFWIHYLSHELVGLDVEEIRREYLDKYPQLEKALDLICLKKT